ncbi:MAG: flagellar biosynthetic protein FliR [Actinomycetota bacterium]|nr:flagellar biosynthetic protein FliR [Actinomycetota bacterium]
MQLDLDLVTAFCLALGRSAAWTLVVPLTANRAVAMTVRVSLAVTLAWAVAPLEVARAPMPTDVAGFVTAFVVQIGIGLVLGWLLALMVTAFDVAGAMVDLFAGFSLAAVFNPATNDIAAPFARLSQATFVALLFATGGYLQVVAGFLASFEAVPAAATSGLDLDAMVAASALGDMLVIATRMAMPVVGAVLLTEVALSAAARFAPQANVFILGLPVKAAVALATMGLVFSYAGPFAERLVDAGLRLGDLMVG